MFKRNVLAVSMTLAALCSAQAAMADVNGGGATLPQPLYQTAGVLPTGFAQYIGVGSGNGKAAFLTNDYTKFVAGVTNKNVHWAGSDSKLTATELSTYASAKQPTWGKLIQVPSVATSVAIPFNKSGTGTAGVNLSVDQLCGVFSGRLTSWSQIDPSLSGDIKVVYRKANSGTTELFTRFLKAKCNPTLEGGTFAVTQAFDASFSRGLPVGAISPLEQIDPNSTATPKATFKDTSEGVMSTLNVAEGRITYMSPDYAATSLAGLEDATKVAKVAGVSPAPANVLTAISNVTPPTTNLDNQNLWVPVFGNADPSDASVVPYPSAGYPILGFTNVIFSQCYVNADQTSQVRAFFTRHYGSNALTNNDAAIRNNRFVPLPANWKTAIRDNFLTATSNLSIGKTDVCNAIGRPL
ncbi:ABC-type phosphate transport system, substrate-binding protein [Pseudomonas cedrina]|uniref:Alkaline phosphatase n=2 Tax=Pseudomonas cedrina TaxID=651740 RepID=A0A1V2JZG2_PSECE|nr:substrate-binding domain-containing protein [Pseudomonas cedrina]ONH50600.1 alkaline phosphatase [Pseudomonas cedrina subsp. cedrina]SDS40765.1 ABC-type phosphate transport system, substrate-binding protein [Pseudomonas cedrina]